MKTEWLQAFVEVADRGSYEDAAQALGVSQPTVWKHVNNLSLAVDVQLIAPGSARVTASGAQLLGLARKVLKDVRDIDDVADRLREGVIGVVKIACYPAHVRRFLAPVCGAFKVAFQDVRVEFAPFNDQGTSGRAQLELLADGDVDLAVGPRQDRFDGKLIYEAQLVVVLPEDHKDRRAESLTITQLAGQTLLVPPRGYHTRTQLDTAFERAGHPLRVELEAGHWGALWALGLHGLGVAVIPDDNIPPEYSGPPFPVLLDGDGVPFRKETWLQSRRGEQPSRAVVSFAQFVDTWLKEAQNRRLNSEIESRLVSP